MKSYNPRKRTDNLHSFKLTHQDIRKIMDDPDVRILGNEDVPEDQMFLIRTIRPNGTTKYMREMLSHHTLAIKFNAVKITVKEDTYDDTDVIDKIGDFIAEGGLIVSGYSEVLPKLLGVKVGGESIIRDSSLPAGVVVGGGEPLKGFCFEGWAHIPKEEIAFKANASVLCGGSAVLEVVIDNAGAVCSGEAINEHDIRTIVLSKIHMKFKNVLSEQTEPPFSFESDPFKNVVFERISSDPNLRIVFHIVKRQEFQSAGLKYFIDTLAGETIDYLVEDEYTIVMGIYDKRDLRNIALDVKRIEHFDEIEIANVEKEYAIVNEIVPDYVKSINGGTYHIVRKLELEHSLLGDSLLGDYSRDVILSGYSIVTLVKEGTNVLLSGESVLQVSHPSVRCGGETCFVHYIDSLGVEESTCFDVVNKNTSTYYCIDCFKWTGATIVRPIEDYQFGYYEKDELSTDYKFIPQEETGLNEVGLCCCDAITAIYLRPHREASEAGIKDVQFMLSYNKKWIRGPSESRVVGGRGLLNDCTMTPANIKFYPITLFYIPENIKLPNANLLTDQELIESYKDRYKDDLYRTYTITDPNGANSQNIIRSWVLAADWWMIFRSQLNVSYSSGLTKVIGYSKKELNRRPDLYLYPDGEILNGALPHFDECVLNPFIVPPKCLDSSDIIRWPEDINFGPRAGRDCMDSNRPFLMTKYNCMQLMGVKDATNSIIDPDYPNIFEEGRFIPDSERKAFDPNECDKCQDACCYPVYNCSTCTSPESLPSIVYNISANGSFQMTYFNEVEEKIKTITGDTFSTVEYLVSSAESESPITLNKAGWKSENNYPEKILGETIVWWKCVFRRVISTVVNLNAADDNQGAPLPYGPGATCDYEKYFCLLCKDGELIDITEESIYGAKLKVYIHRDDVPPVSDGSFGLVYFESRIYTEFALGGVSATGRANYLYEEEMHGGVVVGMYSVGGVIFGSRTLNNVIYKETGDGGIVLNSSTFHTDFNIKAMSFIDDRPELYIPFKTMDEHDEYVSRNIGKLEEVNIGDAIDISYVYVHFNLDAFTEQATRQNIVVNRVETIEQAESVLVSFMQGFSNTITISGFSFFNPDFGPAAAADQGEGIGFNNVMQVVGHTDFNFWDYPDKPETYPNGFGSWFDVPVSMDCSDQEPAYYECEDKLGRKVEEQGIVPPTSLVVKDKKDWCEKTKKGKFHTTKICEEVVCPEPEVSLLNKNKKRFKRENPLP